ncbi:reverse transcriptase domain-containing protein [Tanacetum coccineum]
MMRFVRSFVLGIILGFPLMIFQVAIPHFERSEPFTSEFILEEIDAFLYDKSISLESDHDDCDPKEDIYVLEQLLNDDPFQLPPMDLKQRYFQIPIDPHDQEKMTFTCPYGTFAYRRMPFGLCNALGTFQRCMMAIFHDMIEKTMEVFMDDFSIFGDSFDSCLSNLERMLKRCEDTNLVLNWEKCHFMCKEGIVLGHKILKSGIEVDRAKVDVIAKLPHPITVKGVKSFLGHAGFYRHCINAFETLKKKLTEVPILVVPDWNLPFELMCDASDYAIGAVVLGKVISNESTPWFADFANYHAGNFLVKGMTTQQKRKFLKDVKHYFWDDPYLFRTCADQIIRRCVFGNEALEISGLPCGPHQRAITVPTSQLEKVFDADSLALQFNMDAYELIKSCDGMSKTRKSLHRG